MTSQLRIRAAVVIIAIVAAVLKSFVFNGSGESLTQPAASRATIPTTAGTLGAAEPTLGGLYSIVTGDGAYSVAKVIGLNDETINVSLYAERFATRPLTIDPNQLTFGTISDESFGVVNVPISRQSFASWQPLYIKTVAITAEEQNAIQTWLHGNGGTFGL